MKSGKNTNFRLKMDLKKQKNMLFSLSVHENMKLIKEEERKGSYHIIHERR